MKHVFLLIITWFSFAAHGAAPIAPKYFDKLPEALIKNVIVHGVAQNAQEMGMLIHTLSLTCKRNNTIVSKEKLRLLATYYMLVADSLSKQPLFNAPYNYATKYKVLLLKNEDKGIFRELNILAKPFIAKDKEWPLLYFGDGNHQIFSNNKALGDGIALNLDKPQELLPLPSLKDAYQQAIRELQHGWQLTTIEQYPDIFFKEQPEEWLLFIKNGKWGEDCLIRLLTFKFNYGLKINCNNQWLNSQRRLESRNTIYLWVHKSIATSWLNLLNILLPAQKPEIYQVA